MSPRLPLLKAMRGRPSRPNVGGTSNRGLSLVGVFLLAANLGVLSAGGLLLWTGLDDEREKMLPNRFSRALEEARRPSSHDVSDALIPLSEDTPGLVWDDGANPRRVLVATFTDYRGYDRHVTQSCRLEQEAWVSPVPQLQGRCRQFELSGPSLNERVAQYLGLRPNGHHDAVVEIWVSSEAVFRPCADPEVDDTACRLGLPDVSGEAREPARKHARWFKNMLETYYGERPYPWTRLGYTYDWSGCGTKVGASEYVIPRGTVVSIGSVTSTGDYCGGSGGPDRQPIPRPGPGAIPPC